MSLASPAASSSRPVLGLALVLVLVLGLMQGWQWWQQEQAANAVKALAKPGHITMYTTDTCPYCAKARVWLAGHEIPFRECNVDRDPSCRAEFDAQGAPGVPLMHVQGHWQLGFDAQWLTLALQKPARQPRPSSAGSPRP